MNYWLAAPNRDEVLDKIFDFIKLMSEKKPDEAEKLIRVGSMSKFRDTLHYYIADYAIMIFDDKEYLDLPDDFSIFISDPYKMNEEDIEPRFSGKKLVLENMETIRVRVGLYNEITPIVLEFMINELDNKFFLNLMKVEKE